MNNEGKRQNGWLKDGGKCYYFNAEGVMQKWWFKEGDTWYYLNGSGALAVSTTINGYTVNANGEWV